MIKLNIKLKNIPCYVYMNICYFKEENGEVYGYKKVKENFKVKDRIDSILRN